MVTAVSADYIRENTVLLKKRKNNSNQFNMGYIKTYK